MLIQCTNKLLNELKIDPQKLSAVPSAEPLFSWHAHVVTVNRKKIVVLVNDESRYSVILFGLKARDFKNFDHIVLTALRDSLRYEGVLPDIAESYIDHAPEVVYTGTKNHRTVGIMNGKCREVGYYLRELRDEALYQPAISAAQSRGSFQNEFGEDERPVDALYVALGIFAGRRAFDDRAVQLKVTLDLDGAFDVWRRLIVPLKISFEKFHEVLQRAFGWLGYHLHDFYVLGDAGHPIAQLVCDNEAFEYPFNDDIEMKLDSRVLLSDMIPAYTKIKYDYDFGDNWQHYIEIERIIEDYGKDYAECIEGDGNTPPEDVGGTSGYERFREIVSDPRNEEYEETMTWAESLNYREFDIERVRRIFYR